MIQTNCFIQSLLAEVDALIYVDTDTLFLSPPEDLWNYFYHFNSSHEMAASLAREYVDTKILMKDGIPVLRKDGKAFHNNRVRISSDIIIYQKELFLFPIIFRKTMLSKIT